MTSKKDLRTDAEFWRNEWNTEAGRRAQSAGESAELRVNIMSIAKERDTFKKESEHLARSLEHTGEHVNSLARFLDDVLVIEPQLKHLLTHGVWDFERVHRAAEHLRGEDALESVGYTSNCVEIDMSNVIPFPTDPDSTYRGAA